LLAEHRSNIKEYNYARKFLDKKKEEIEERMKKEKEKEIEELRKKLEQMENEK
jgi:HAMP domain-containing protein